MVLSIGVPVYNAEKTLERCLKSIVSSDGFDDYEVVCLDDGSTDSSSAILDKWSSAYENIRVLYTENRGAFLARQRIIGVARGDWISFVDADDMVTHSMFEDMLKAVRRHKSTDMAVCAFKSQSKIYMNGFRDSYIRLSGNGNNLGRVLAVNPAYWNKIFRCDIAKKAVRLDYSPKIMEDSIFFCSIVPYVRGIEFIYKPLYIYESNDTGVTNKIGIKEIHDAEKGIRDLLDNLNSHNGWGKNNNYRDFLDAYVSLHLGVAFSVNYNEHNGLKSIIRVWRETLGFLDRELPHWRRNRFLSMGYAVRNREIRRLYIGYVLYKSSFWPAVMILYRVFYRITGFDLKW